MLRFPTQTMEAERHVRDALARTALLGVLIASAVALVVALYVSMRVTRPVMALTTAAGDLAAGRRAARVDTNGPGELRVLAEAFNDMADNLDREDQLRRNLVADVAHELRTPLAILQGTTEALLDGVDQPTPEVLGSLHDEVTRLRRLVADLETLAAAEAAGLRLHSRDSELADVATGATDLLRPLADEQELTLVTDIHPAPTFGDPDRLQQVAVNLIANAIKFTPAGGTITVRTAVTGGRAVLEVSDTGPGIRADEIAHVFERFWRGTNGATASGSGIGLAVVAELVTAHHGDVHATNNDTAGVCFTVSLPLESRDHTATGD
jgi:signal transduction histidine kinase